MCLIHGVTLQTSVLLIRVRDHTCERMFGEGIMHIMACSHLYCLVLVLFPRVLLAVGETSCMHACMQRLKTEYNTHESTFNIVHYTCIYLLRRIYM
jgi:hypothetical protein